MCGLGGAITQPAALQCECLQSLRVGYRFLYVLGVYLGVIRVCAGIAKAPDGAAAA